MTIRFLTASGVLLSWVLFFGAFLGLGYGVRRLIGDRDSTESESLFLTFWLGLAVGVLGTQLWHIFFPVRLFVGVVWLCLGFWGFKKNREAFRSEVTGATTNLGTFGSVLLLLLVGWAALWAAGPPGSYDTGMYDVPSVMWIVNFPVVPGLGNLHGRLAFNQSSHLLAALVEPGTTLRWSHHVINGLFLSVLLARIILSIFEYVRGKREAASLLFDVTLLAPTLLLVQSHRHSSSLPADVPAAVALFFCGRWLFSLLASRRSMLEPAKTTVILGLLSALAVAPTFKLSSAGFVLGSLVALGVFRRKVGVIPKRVLVLSVFVVVGLWGTWAFRSAVMTGYLAYPVDVLPLPVDWRVPETQVSAEIEWTRFFGQWYHDVPRGITLRSTEPDSGWIGPWTKAALNGFGRWYVLYPLLLAFSVIVGSLALILFFPERGYGRGWRRGGMPWLLGVPVFALAFWWLAVPHPDFGMASAWVLAAVAVSAAGEDMTVSFGPRLILLAGICLTAGAVLPEAGANLLFGKAPLPFSLEDGSIPKPEVDSVTTRSGLILLAPTKDNRCWDAPLPCTPHPAPNLQLRRPGDLRWGFRVEGEWVPTRWPNRVTQFPLGEGA